MKNFNRRSSSIFWCALGFVLTAFVVLAQPTLAQDDSPAATSTMSLFFASLAVAAVICLILGWENPKRFKFVLGDKATTPFVRGGFGAAILVFGFLGQSLDPGRADDQIAANERRVAKSQARVRDAQEREREAKASESQAQKSAREAQFKQHQAQKEATRAQKQAESAKARKIHDDEQASKQSAGADAGTDANAKNKSPNNWEKKLDGLLDSVAKIQKIQSYAETDGVTLTLRNRDDFAWTDVKININPTFGYLGGYEYKVKEMRSGGEIIVPLRDFANPKGERLNPVEIKLLTFALRCQTPDGKGASMGSWPS